MSEDLKKAAYILATLSQHIEFPFKNQWLSKIFQNAFTSGIDDESLRVLKTWIKSKWSGTFPYVKEIIKYQEWEDIFAWPNELLQPFQVADIPKKIEKVGFFLCCTNNNYIEEIEGYILVVKLFLPEGILKCKYGEEWKDCSSQETGINDKPKISNAIFGFVKNWEEPPKNEIEKAEDQGTRTEKIKDNPQYVIENDTKNINADQINEKFKQIEEELSKCKQINECLKAELTDVKIENKKASNDISEVKAMIENMRSSLNEKIDETSIDIKKSLNYLKEGLDKGQLFMENVLENCQSNLNQLKSYKNLSTSSKSVPLKKNQDFSFPFNAVSDYFQCINKTAQDCIQKYNELEIKYNSLIDISNNMMIETNKMHSALEAKINEIEEKTQKISIPNGNELISSTKNALDSKTINKDNPKRKKRGLANIGNSCYMNSVLQIFASIPSFIENIKNIENDLFYCLGGIISSITDPYSIKTDEKLRKLRNLLAKKYPMVIYI
ncbi:unnamed protein product [Blepharisma stoltei]|uniref:USP domain-containing protein n=1 Tax=Blepharisma stoltei TaxID=1481888 RepID=A0AAU9IGU1_9CILI|nr:unnamed protein product [Blepharisma stoltei]